MHYSLALPIYYSKRKVDWGVVNAWQSDFLVFHYCLVKVFKIKGSNKHAIA